MMRAQRRRNGMAAWLAMLLAAGGSAPAAAMTFMEVDYVCPVGGERFRAQTMGSGTVFRHFLDGQAEGAIMSPWPLVRCPGNGFVMYRDDFSAAEIATLTPFVEGEEYQRLRRVETSYWLAARLMEALGVPLAERAGVLQRATWQASPEQYPRYVEAAAAAFAAACPDDADGRDEQWLYCQLIRGEWERRTSRFEQARLRFERLQPLPERLVAAERAWVRAQYRVEIAQQLERVADGDTRSVLAREAPAPDRTGGPAGGADAESMAEAAAIAAEAAAREDAPEDPAP